MNATATDYEAARAIRAAQRSAAVAVLVAANPGLVSAASNSLIAATKNIRRELSRAFPSVKFAVRSSRFAGGNSITVAWTDGPTSAQVDAIVGKYSAGSFDGSTDCYNYDVSAWNDAFGSAKYVHTTRDYSDRVVASILSRVAKYWDAATVPTVAEYRSGSLWKVKANCSDFSTEIHRAMSRHTCAISARVQA